MSSRRTSQSLDRTVAQAGGISRTRTLNRRSDGAGSRSRHIRRSNGSTRFEMSGGRPQTLTHMALVDPLHPKVLLPLHTFGRQNCIVFLIVFIILIKSSSARTTLAGVGGIGDERRGQIVGGVDGVLISGGGFGGGMTCIVGDDGKCIDLLVGGGKDM